MNEVWFPLPKDAFCQVWLILAKRFWRRRLSKVIVKVLSQFWYLPLEKELTVHVIGQQGMLTPLMHLISPLVYPGVSVCHALILYCFSFTCTRLIRVHYLCLNCLAMWPFIWSNLNPPLPEDIWVKFGWNWTSGSGEDVKNLKSLQMDRQTSNYRQSKKITCAFN